MNNNLIILVGIIYLIVSVNLYNQHQYGLSLAFLFYALANLGLFLASKGV